ncbi:glycosyltransferase family 4 protein [Pontixanthobacter gangjinensis]|uniref:Glycosyltransferase n=1 Tax=Pontixanthobacter gangjinensis TaxID=1028742 RepID=A0A6I4SKI2_9SPHN|nr:glycosyltransferase family 4 protein [Pontixanthobacter gangjinensis]MXO55640.1 glycosyltransferase [Pontixanthobacter gangjinensis]
MRLLFVIKGLVIAGGGAERVFVDVVNALTKRGHDVQVATFDRPDQKIFYDLDPAIPVHLLGAGDPGVPTPRFNMPMIMRRIRALARQIEPDAAVAFMHSTYVPIAFGLLGTGIPMILSEHTAGAHFDARPLQKALTRLTQRLSYAKTVVSPVIKAEHPISYHGNLAVLANPVDMHAFAPARLALPEKIILCVGGLRVEKGQDVLIKAFERIAGKFPDWRLRFVGDGVTRPQVEAQIAASPVKERIELPGVLKDVPAEYAKAAFVAVPSTYESLSMVAIEAMASSRPVIGFSDCAGPRALIEEGLNGLLIDPGDDKIAALSAAMTKLMQDQALRERMGKQAPDTVVAYSAEHVFDQWEELLGAAAHNMPVPKFA